jgi:hypothetical protein
VNKNVHKNHHEAGDSNSCCLHSLPPLVFSSFPFLTLDPEFLPPSAHFLPVHLLDGHVTLLQMVRKMIQGKVSLALALLQVVERTEQTGRCHEAAGNDKEGKDRLERHGPAAFVCVCVALLFCVPRPKDYIVDIRLFAFFLRCRYNNNQEKVCVPKETSRGFQSRVTVFLTSATFGTNNEQHTDNLNVYNI